MRPSPLAMALFAALALSSARAETLSAPPPSAPAQLTEDQARSRIEETGYTQVGELRRDARGLWHGRASRNGDPREVSLDAQGNLEDSWELTALTMFDRETGDLRTAQSQPLAGASAFVVQVSH